ncbi:MAG: hypothetical protein ACLVLH_10550 [Eisenbergiella massiliensis]
MTASRKKLIQAAFSYEQARGRFPTVRAGQKRRQYQNQQCQNQQLLAAKPAERILMKGGADKWQSNTKQ